MCDHSLLHMPLIVLTNIFMLLDLPDLRSLMLTCRTMRDLIMNENSLLKSISRKRFIVMSSNRDLNLSWYNRCRISNNWYKGIYRKKVIITHYMKYMPWVQFIDSQLLYLSVGSELRCYAVDKRAANAKNLWALEVRKVQRLDIRTNDISRFVIRDDTLLCANRDGCVTTYKFRDKTKRPHLVSHIKDCHKKGTAEVSAIEKAKDVVITVSSNDPKVCFWQLPLNERDHANKSNCRNSNPFYRNEVELADCSGCRCVSVNKGQDKVAIGLNGDNHPVVLDIDTGSVLLCNTNEIYTYDMIRDIQWHDENVIAYVTHSGKVSMMDTRNSEMVYTEHDPFYERMYCLKTDSDRMVLVGSSEYSRCVLYDTRCQKHVQIYFTQKKTSPVYSLDFDATRLIAAADRGVASVNFNVNSSITQKRDYSYDVLFLRRKNT